MEDKARYINQIVGTKHKGKDIEEKVKTVQAVVPDWTPEEILEVLVSTNYNAERAIHDIFEGNAKKNNTPFYYGKKTQKSQDEKQNGKESKPYRKPRQDQGPRKDKDKPSGKGPRGQKSKYEKKKDNKDNTEAQPTNGTPNGNTVSESPQPQISENKPVVEEQKTTEDTQNTSSTSAETSSVTPVPTTSSQTTSSTPSTSAPVSQPTHSTKSQNQAVKKTWKVRAPASTSQSHEHGHSTPSEVVQPSSTNADSSSTSSVVLPPSAKHALQESGPNIRFGGANASVPSVKTSTQTHSEAPVVTLQQQQPKSDTVTQANQVTQQQQQQQQGQVNAQGQQVPFMNFGYPPFFAQNPYQFGTNPTASTNNSTSPAPVPFPFAHSYFDMYAMWEMMNQYNQMQLQQQQSQQPTSGSTSTATPSTSSTQTQSHFPFFPPGPTPMMSPMMGAFPYYSYADQHGNTQGTSQSSTPTTGNATSSQQQQQQQSQQNAAFPQHFQAPSTTNATANSGSNNRYQIPDYSQTQMDQQSFGQPYLNYSDYSSTYYNQQKNYPQNRFP